MSIEQEEDARSDRRSSTQRLEEYKFGDGYSEAADTEAQGDLPEVPPPLPPPPVDPNVIVLKRSDFHEMLDAMAEAGDLAVAAKNYELGKKLKKIVSDHAETAVKRVKKPENKIVFKAGFTLGQTVEVRYVIDDIIHWDSARIVPGSGGGLYSIEFDNGEIWDKIPPEDIRPCSSPVGEAAPEGTFRTTKKRLKGSWNLATQSESIMYNGWVMLKAHDWMSRTRQTWGMIIASRFYFGDNPLTEDWNTRDLLYADVKGTEGTKTIRVVNERFDYAITVQLLNDYEYKVWLKQFETAALRAVKNPDYTRIVELENEMKDILKRPILPLFDGKSMPEEKTIHTLSGSIVTATGGGWFGGKDWKRRYLTLHPNWLCIRPEKTVLQGLEVLPFRETKCWQTPMPDHPHTLEISGTFIQSHYICFDDENTCRTWKAALLTAIATSNPEDTLNNNNADEQRGLL
eukprot:TRINITY_DN1650_c0_g1_i6.p1 TRINITY_DN1650_c0_g1~~TRINITY_DN1650_c0_g1_i6.p1  ORF type:complete len:458 (+),score=110.64 TRINITY_DN1650_c0_g1_i6:74-1447(+)